MYTPQPPARPEQTWPPSLPAPIAAQPIAEADLSSAPPSYVPPPALPYLAEGEEARPTRAWLRIPVEKPVLTLAILAALVAIYALMMLLPQVGEVMYRQGALYKLYVANGEWWRLLTSTFLHSPVLIIHILLNGYSLYAVGMDLEAFYGRARFAAIYFISALAGSVASFIFSPALVLGQPTSGVGASGAIFGLVGALAVYFGLHKNLFGKLGQAQFWNIILVIGINVGIGFSGIFPIDNSAHLGGLAAGIAVGFVLCPRYALGDWTERNVRQLINTNRSRLAWAATALLALTVVAIFIVGWLRYTLGY